MLGGNPSPVVLGHMLSFASGIMMYISYCDLLAHAQAELNSFFLANIWVRVRGRESVPTLEERCSPQKVHVCVCL